MYILVTAATRLEIQPTIRFLEEQGRRLEGHRTEILIGGVGFVATSYALTREIMRQRPDLILQAGIAGCFVSQPRPPGKVVAIAEECLHEGVWENGRFQSLFDLRLTDPDEAPFTRGMLINPQKKLLQWSELEPVRSLSVSEISTDQGRIAWLQQNVHPVVESMEGGAFHYVCLKEQIPFLQIRAVSNSVGVRDKTKWNIPLAVSTLNEKLIGLLKRFDHATDPWL